MSSPDEQNLLNLRLIIAPYKNPHIWFIATKKELEAASAKSKVQILENAENIIESLRVNNHISDIAADNMICILERT